MSLTATTTTTAAAVADNVVSIRNNVYSLIDYLKTHQALYLDNIVGFIIHPSLDYSTKRYFLFRFLASLTPVLASQVFNTVFIKHRQSVERALTKNQVEDLLLLFMACDVTTSHLQIQILLEIDKTKWGILFNHKAKVASLGLCIEMMMI